MKQIVSAFAVVVVVGCLTPLRSYAGEEVGDPRIEKGRVSYEKYCTPCHGAGGAPGSAVFAATKKPVDVRTFAERNGGNFPTGRWWDVAFSPKPGNVHAKVWERIHNDQRDTAERDAVTRSVIVNIEDYVISIQNKAE